MEAWEKVLVSSAFLTTQHGELNCTSCHGGSDLPQSMEQAHIGVVADPSSSAENSCAECHADYDSKHKQSLHASLEGYKETIRARAGQGQLSPELEGMFQAQCATCHTSCGQCHISRPTSVGGGFIAGHNFNRRPSMTENCTACHGSRIGEEFRGQHAGISADVHYNRGMQCVACHSAEDVHASTPGAKHRYDESSPVRCEDCHEIANSNAYHAVHNDRLSCQVCHSQPYKNCYSCHVGQDSKGLMQPSELDFKIGRNPIKSASKPFDYVVLRHVPIAPNSYDDWAPGQLTNFAALPTWKYATPHNIQKNTPQTANCTSSCHNNADVFLTPNDLQKLTPEEQAANATVVVDEIPN
ncbi:hypothetical protein MJD09_24810 [bacterium]|nr:hypothetical protein [bacterium]